jgi:hypothetical protein
MVKSAEKPTVTEPAPQSKITVTVKMLVPIIAYGNIELAATQEILCNADDPAGRSAATIAGLFLLKTDLAQVILPLVDAEVTRYASVLLKETNPSYWLSKQSSVYQWFRIAYPDIEIPAMQAVLDSKSVPDSGLE